MGGGVVGRSVGMTFCSGDTPANDTRLLRPEKMFTMLKQKTQMCFRSQYDLFIINLKSNDHATVSFLKLGCYLRKSFFLTLLCRLCHQVAVNQEEHKSKMSHDDTLHVGFLFSWDLWKTN